MGARSFTVRVRLTRFWMNLPFVSTAPLGRGTGKSETRSRFSNAQVLISRREHLYIVSCCQWAILIYLSACMRIPARRLLTIILIKVECNAYTSNRKFVLRSHHVSQAEFLLSSGLIHSLEIYW